MTTIPAMPVVLVASYHRKLGLATRLAGARPLIGSGGFLETWLGETRVNVNSVHSQGIARLAPTLRAEVFAADGLIEAISDPPAPAFNLGVPWHPEWRAAGNPISRCQLGKFGDVCRQRQQR